MYRILLTIFFLLKFSSAIYTSDIKDIDYEDTIKKISLIAVYRSLLGSIIEHPFNRLVTYMQAYPSKNIPNTISHLRREKGLKSFYDGFSARLGSAALRNIYVWPSLAILPKIYSQILPSSFEENNNATKKVLTGLTISALDAFIATPFERIKVLLMTNNDDKSSLSHLLKINNRINYKSLMHELYRGGPALFYANSVTWIPYLYLDHHLRLYAKNNNMHKNLDFSSLIGVSAVLTIFDVALWMPFQMAKTNQQKVDPINQKNPFKLIYNLGKIHGIKYLYRGSTIELARTFIMTILDTYYLDQLDTKK